jgi:predicted nucleotidyltransferase
MEKQEAIDILRRHREALQARGVQHAALFGSAARDEADNESDIDVLIELDPAFGIDLFAYVGLTRYIAGMFDTPVDVVDVDALKPHIRPAAKADAIYAF